MKTGGVFTGALPYDKNFNYRICPNCNNHFEIDGHVSRHDLKTLKTIFVENGFKIIHLENFNLNYSLKNVGIIKKIYRYLYYGVFRVDPKSSSQIEYMVTINE